MPQKMLDTANNYAKTIKVNANSTLIFKALTENLHLWWGKTTNHNFKTGGHFTVHFENGYWWTFKIMEYTPNHELVWKCIDGEPDFNKEWIGHVLHWEIKASELSTYIQLTHFGLTPETDCFDVCSKTWNMYIEKHLKKFLHSKNTSV
ncbi:hypothetical protein A9Q87_03125 [Flavobacteriales bacterium 34_180_T64]|nr:hypothetical protein A9Q87_03125 [Flavobacteriales bacterium 34_180_T64]